MKFEPWQREFDVALGAVREAAVLARDIRHHFGGQAFLKADQSPVTVADLAVEALIAHRLDQDFPDDPLVAEEGSASFRSPEAQLVRRSVLEVLRRVMPDLDSDRVLGAIDRGRGSPGERFWTLDPIDGTQGFVRGDQYVVALALVVRGEVQIGMLGCPRLSLTPLGSGVTADDRQRDEGSLVFAVRNQGAFRESLTGGEFAPLHVSSRLEPRLARVFRSVESDHIDVDAFNEAFRTLAVEARQC